MTCNRLVFCMVTSCVIVFSGGHSQERICGVKAKNNWTEITLSDKFHGYPYKHCHTNVTISCNDQHNHLELKGLDWFACCYDQTLDREKEAPFYCEPTCSPIRAEAYIEVVYQSASIDKGENYGRYTVGSKAAYYCKNKTNYIRGPSETVCQDDGKFSPSPPTCGYTCDTTKLNSKLGGLLNSAISVEFLDPPQGNWYPNQYSRAVLSCMATDPQSQQLINKKEISCLENGSWEDPGPLECVYVADQQSGIPRGCDAPYITFLIIAGCLLFIVAAAALVFFCIKKKSSIRMNGGRQVDHPLTDGGYLVPTAIPGKAEAELEYHNEEADYINESILGSSIRMNGGRQADRPVTDGGYLVPIITPSAGEAKAQSAEHQYEEIKEIGVYVS